MVLRSERCILQWIYSYIQIRSFQEQGIYFYCCCCSHYCPFSSHTTEQVPSKLPQPPNPTHRTTHPQLTASTSPPSSRHPPPPPHRLLVLRPPAPSKSLALVGQPSRPTPPPSLPPSLARRGSWSRRSCRRRIRLLRWCVGGGWK